MITTTEQSEYTHTATWWESMDQVTNAEETPEPPEMACGTWIVMLGSGDEDKPAMSDLSPEERERLILDHIWGER